MPARTLSDAVFRYVSNGFRGSGNVVWVHKAVELPGLTGRHVQTVLLHLAHTADGASMVCGSLRQHVLPVMIPCSLLLFPM